MDSAEIEKQLPCVLAKTDFPDAGSIRRVSNWDIYSSDNKASYIATDRFSSAAGDIVFPYWGELSVALTKFFIDSFRPILEPSILSSPNTNTLILAESEPLRFTVDVSLFLYGSLFIHYKNDSLPEYGKSLRRGMELYQRFEEPYVSFINPSPNEDRFLPNDLSQIEMSLIDAAARTLFLKLHNRAAQSGLQLARLRLNFSRTEKGLIFSIVENPFRLGVYWLKHDEEISAALPPEELSRDPTKLWLSSLGFKGVGPMPEVPDRILVELSKHFIEYYQRITGLTFTGSEGDFFDRLNKGST